MLTVTDTLPSGINCGFGIEKFIQESLILNVMASDFFLSTGASVRQDGILQVLHPLNSCRIGPVYVSYVL